MSVGVSVFAQASPTAKRSHRARRAIVDPFLVRIRLLLQIGAAAHDNNNSCSSFSGISNSLPCAQSAPECERSPIPILHSDSQNDSTRAGDSSALNVLCAACLQPAAGALACRDSRADTRSVCERVDCIFSCLSASLLGPTSTWPVVAVDYLPTTTTTTTTAAL